MSNPQRGEVSLRLDSRDLALAPSFALLAEVEAELGPLPGLLRRLAAEDWPATELARVLRLAVAHAPGAPADERVEGLLLAAGLARLRPLAVELLLNALDGVEGAAAPESQAEASWSEEVAQGKPKGNPVGKPGRAAASTGRA